MAESDKEKVISDDFTSMSRGHRKKLWTVNDINLKWLNGLDVWPGIYAVAATLPIAFALIVTVPRLELSPMTSLAWTVVGPLGVLAGLYFSFARMAENDTVKGSSLFDRLALAYDYWRRQPRTISGVQEIKEPHSVRWVTIFYKPGTAASPEDPSA